MNTQSVPPDGGLSSSALERFMASGAQIAALHGERARLLRECPGLFCPEVLSREHRATLAVDFDFRVDRMPMDVLRDFMDRMPLADTCPASLTKDEAQIIVAYRFISHGCYGELHVQTSEKRRVKIGVTLNGR